MQRGSDRLNVHHDDEMKHQLQGMLRSGHPTRAEGWHDPEPEADDDPDIGHGPTGQPGDAERADEELRSELARHLGRTPFPGKRGALLRTLRERYAPDRLVGMVEQLPDNETYENVQEVMAALGRKPRA
ncbi:DUF2795 domain-containing protein [Streptomyces sp. Ru87]|uniref:DUF2795 domain-containing protein n=2 Tax=Streptomyces lycii TaxID=2654337 RepID=A0ABQ7FH09_9ACTN|nr:DUF2795 domain-containing protein [Streptomyces lycii]PGH47818.1 DUF2795 domain-containing protein [Streptomyces sp. Ru87]